MARPNVASENVASRSNIATKQIIVSQKICGNLRLVAVPVRSSRSAANSSTFLRISA